MTTYPACSWSDDGGDLVYTLPTSIDRITGDDAQEDNTARAQYAAVALHHFANAVAPHGEETETVLGDLLANLMHFADAADISFESCLDRGRMHYGAEITGEDY